MPDSFGQRVEFGTVPRFEIRVLGPPVGILVADLGEAGASYTTAVIDWILPLAVAALVVLLVSRRIRRLFRRQPFSVARLVLRLALLSGVCTMLFLILSLAKGWVPLAGLGIGATVGLLGIVLTRFDSTDGKLHFTPNPYVGIAVLSLLIVRLVHRLSRLENLSDVTLPQEGAGFSGLSASPSTVGVLFVILGFYLMYNAGVLLRGQALRQRSPAG